MYYNKSTTLTTRDILVPSLQQSLILAACLPTRVGTRVALSNTSLVRTHSLVYQQLDSDIST